ncbi:MAG: saccharopine dehydrogenase family protein [Micromonosporaceae bacterium]
MAGRIVLYGATGYTGRLTAQALVACGARPVLAGRDAGRLHALSARLSRSSGNGDEFETAVAAADEPSALRKLIGAGDVLVSTAGPFFRIGRAAVEAAVDAGAMYFDSTGEPPFIRQVFEEYGPRAQQTVSVLLTAFGYDYVPGNLAAALALLEAGPLARRVGIGYFARGDMRKALSAGTRASVAGMIFEQGHAYRGGRIVPQRAAAELASFGIAGKAREAFCVGGSEHFALPRLQLPCASQLTDVGVYLGWSDSAVRVVHYASALSPLLGRLPLVRRVADAQAGRIQRSRGEPDPSERVRSDVLAVAYGPDGQSLARVHLTGGDPYSFTSGILAWAACRAAATAVTPAGALGPAEAFGVEVLEEGCASAGITRVNAAS